MNEIKFFFLLFSLFLNTKIHSQCTSCTFTNPVSSGNYTFSAGSTVCFTSNVSLNDVSFQNNSKICIAPGVTVKIQNNVSTNTGDNITFEIGGILEFDQSITFNANLTANILNGGKLQDGISGSNNFSFGGNSNIINNFGIVEFGLLQFQNPSSTNIFDNHGTISIASNINIQGSTSFRNWNVINIGSSYNNNPNSLYINCGTINSNNGFNLGGGRVINTGNFNIGNGQVDLGGGTLENYGTLSSLGTINGTAASSFYNEGLAKIASFQPNGTSIKGPTSSNKKGYFYIINQINHNGSKIGPNLDFKKYTGFSPDTVSGIQGESQIFSNTPTYVDATGTFTTAALANVTYDCSICSAPLVVSIGVCPNIDGTLPPSFCYKPAVLDAAHTYPSKFGITALGRAGAANNGNWPMVRQGAWAVLEAKTKGFVINRVAFSDTDNNPSTPEEPVGIPPANFVEGMMVYDTTNNCLKIYTTDGTTFAWHCITTQTCPD